MNAIIVPSGDHAARETFRVSSALLEPSVATVHRSKGPCFEAVSCARKAILVPSGDQTGAISSAEALVKRVKPEPSVLIEKMSPRW
jgi:hypothetical protein